MTENEPKPDWCDGVPWCSDQCPYDNRRDCPAVRRLVEALEALIRDGSPGHYAHWDNEGTAGANCPACIQRQKANDAARAALPPEDLGIRDFPEVTL